MGGQNGGPKVGGGGGMDLQKAVPPYRPLSPHTMKRGVLKDNKLYANNSYISSHFHRICSLFSKDYHSC